MSPDAETVYSISDGLIHIWDVTSATDLGTLPVPDRGNRDPDSGDQYWQLQLSDDGRTLFASDYFGQAALYEVDPANHVEALPLASDCPDVTSVALRAMSGDGRVLAVYRDDQVHFVQLPDCSPIGTTIPALGLNDPALNDDGTLLVASVQDGREMFVWEVATGREVSSFGPMGDYWHPSFASNGSTVAVGMFDGVAHLFDTQTGELLRSYGGHSGAVERAIVSPDGTRLLTSSQDGTARLWELASGIEIRRFVNNAAVRQSVMTGDGRSVYTADDDGMVNGWSAAGETTSYIAGEGEVKGLAFSADGSTLASAGGGFVRVFDRNATEVVTEVPVPDARLVAYSPADGSLLAVSGLGSSFIDPTGGIRELSRGDFSGNTWAGSFSADGSLLLAAAPSTFSQAFLYDSATGNQIQIFQIQAGALSADGTLVAGWFPGRYTLYDAAAGTLGLRWTIPLPLTDVRPVDLVFTPDGSRLVSGDHDNVVRVRDVATGEVLLEMAGHASPIRQVRVSTDGRYALTAGYDGGARYWDLETGELVRFFPGHEGRAVTAIAISVDGQSVALGSADGAVIIAPTSIDDVATEVCSVVGRTLTDLKIGTRSA